MLVNAEWVGVNNLALLIHGTEAVQEMQRYFLEALRNMIPFERAAFFLFDEKDGHIDLVSPIGIGLDPAVFTMYGELINTNAVCRRVINLRRTIAYRSSDLVTPDEKATDSITIIQHAFMLPNEIAYYSGVVLTHERELLGEIALYRTEQQCDFTDKELEILDYLKDHLAIRLQREHQNYHVSVAETAVPSLNGLGLTARESEIVRLIMDQCSTEEISQRLVISPYTTKKHLHHIFSKLGVHSRLQLIEAVHTWEHKQD